MPEKHELMKVIQEWVEKADNDLKNATQTLEQGKECPTDTVCFHAQQCAEKYLKAFLVLKSIDFPKTHDIGELVARLPEKINTKLSVEEQEILTDYATVTRYPGDYDRISLTEAKSAVKIARRFRSEIRKLLPREVILRKRRKG